MDRKILFERVFPEAQRMGIDFKDFKLILERSDFSDIDSINLKLKNMPLFGEESLLTALNIDGEDAQTVAEISTAVPAFSIFFSPAEENNSKAISLLVAQVEALKKLTANFQSSLMTGITGKEVGDEYESTIAGIDSIVGDENVSAKVVQDIIRAFSDITVMGTDAVAGAGASTGGIDEFVMSQSGKKLVSLLKGLRVDANLSKAIDTLFSPVINKLQLQNLKTVMDGLDEADMPEITSENMEVGTVVDYLSGTSGVSELEMAASMNPYVRLGLFYQLCLLQQPEFISRITSEQRGTKLSYPDLISSGKPFEESLKAIFGRNADLSAFGPFMDPLNRISMSMLASVWNSPKSDRIKGTLFIPAMQVMYVSFMNFILAGALYSFLTKKTDIVARVRAEEETQRLKRVEAEKAAMKPSMMPDPERAKVITRIFKSPDLQALLNDTTIYSTKKSGYSPEKVKALKELVYYSFGGKSSTIERVKNWDTTKNPIDGNYDQFFADIIKDIQTAFDVYPIDGKVGPITKSFIKDGIPDAVVELM